MKENDAYLFCSCTEILGLQRSQGALSRLQLVEEYSVIFTIADVPAEIIDSTKTYETLDKEKVSEGTHLRFHPAAFKW